MKIKTMIVDDNANILNSLKKHLESINYIDLIYSTMDSEDFLEMVFELNPDLVIMDIDMPRLSGIELGKRLRDQLPFLEIVFVTSHGEYMKDAFSVYASDFIEKPYNLERLEHTLSRIANKLNISEEVFEIKVQKTVRHIRISEIVFFEAFKRKTTIYTDSEVIEADYTFKDLIDIFNSNLLYKSSRSFCINLQKVDSINPFSRTSYEVSFKNSDNTAVLSKNQYDEFRELIKTKANNEKALTTD